MKTRMKRILAKIGARDRAQAVAIAYQSGLMVSRSESPGRGDGEVGMRT